MSIGGNSNGNAVLAYTRHTQFHRTDLQPFEVDKYLEDVRYVHVLRTCLQVSGMASIL
jgi:hypothetical protein